MQNSLGFISNEILQGSLGMISNEADLQGFTRFVFKLSRLAEFSVAAMIIMGLFSNEADLQS